MSITVKQMVADAKSTIRNLTPDEVEAHLVARDCLLVDVREARELDEHGVIGGAIHAPRGMLEFWADPESPLHQPEFDPTGRLILYCAAGSRSALAVQTLHQFGYQDVAHLDGGIAAWKQAGLPVAGKTT